MQLDDLENRNHTWKEFKNMFLSYYVLEDYKLKKVNNFFELIQRNMSVAEYQAKFVNISHNEDIRALWPQLWEALAPILLTDFATAAAVITQLFGLLFYLKTYFTEVNKSR